MSAQRAPSSQRPRPHAATHQRHPLQPPKKQRAMGQTVPVGKMLSYLKLFITAHMPHMMICFMMLGACGFGIHSATMISEHPTAHSAIALMMQICVMLVGTTLLRTALFKKDERRFISLVSAMPAFTMLGCIHLAAMGMVLFMLSSFEALLPSMIAKLIYIGAVSGIYGLIMTEFGFMVPKAFFKDIIEAADLESLEMNNPLFMALSFTALKATSLIILMASPALLGKMLSLPLIAGVFALTSLLSFTLVGVNFKIVQKLKAPHA